MINKYKHKDVDWIDLENPTPDEVREVVDKYNIDPIVGNELLSPTLRPHVDRYSDYIYMILHFPVAYDTDGKSHEIKEIEEVDFIIGKDFIITDTAGIRKRSRVKDDIEFYSVMRSLRSLEDCDVCMVMVDATRGFESQDMNLIALADRNKKGVLIMVNKWDLVEKDSKTAREYEKKIKNKIAPFDYVPIFFTSVTEKKRIFQSIEMAVKIFENRKQKISTSKLNNTLLPLIEKQPPPAVKGKYIRIKYITQLPSRTPVFAFFCNLPQYIKPAYERFLIKTIRQHYDFTGVPVKVVFRKK